MVFEEAEGEGEAERAEGRKQEELRVEGVGLRVGGVEEEEE